METKKTFAIGWQEIMVMIEKKHMVKVTSISYNENRDCIAGELEE